jgi:hypothetical protein
MMQMIATDANDATDLAMQVASRVRARDATDHTQSVASLASVAGMGVAP